jgi:hypothetical protein
MTNEDLSKLDDVLTQQSRFLAAVVREQGIRVKEQFELLTVNVVCLCFAVGLVVAPLIAESKYPHTGWTSWIAWILWAVMWFGLFLFWHEQTTRVAERTVNAERELWSSYSRDPFEDYRKRTERITETLKQHGR